MAEFDIKRVVVVQEVEADIIKEVVVNIIKEGEADSTKEVEVDIIKEGEADIKEEVVDITIVIDMMDNTLIVFIDIQAIVMII